MAGREPVRITIEIDGRTLREIVREWWHEHLCEWFGHPAFRERKKPDFIFLMGFWDPRPRCVRCGAPDDSRPAHPMQPNRRFEWEERGS